MGHAFIDCDMILSIPKEDEEEDQTQRDREKEIIVIQLAIRYNLENTRSDVKTDIMTTTTERKHYRQERSLAQEWGRREEDVMNVFAWNGKLWYNFKTRLTDKSWGGTIIIIKRYIGRDRCVSYTIPFYLLYTNYCRAHATCKLQAFIYIC